MKNTGMRLAVAAVGMSSLLAAPACNSAEKAAQAARISDATNAAGALKKPLDAIGDYRALLAKRPHETVVDPRIGALAADEIGRAATTPMPASDAGASGLTGRAGTALTAVASACKADPSSKAIDVNDATRSACAKAIDQLESALVSMGNEVGDAGVAWPRVPAADNAASAKTPLGKLALGGDQVAAYWKAFEDKSADPKTIEPLGNKAMGEMGKLGKEVADAAPADSQLKSVAEAQPTAFQIVIQMGLAKTSFAQGVKLCPPVPKDQDEREACVHMCSEIKNTSPENLPASLRDARALCK